MKKLLFLTLAILTVGCSSSSKDDDKYTLTKAEQDEINNVLEGEWGYEIPAGWHVMKFTDTYKFSEFNRKMSDGGYTYENESYTISKSSISGRYRFNLTRLENNYNDFTITTSQSGKVLTVWVSGKGEPKAYERLNP